MPVVDEQGAARGRRSLAAWVTGWTLAYVLAVMLSRLTFTSSAPIALLWPAGGVALAWAVSGGMRRLPWVAAGVATPMALHGLTLAGEPRAVSIFAAAHAAQAVLVGGSYLWVRHRAARRVWPEDTHGLVAVAGCALLGAVATIPLAWWGTGVIYGGVTHEAVIAWVVRNTVSTIVVGLLLLEVLRTRRPGERPGARPTARELGFLALAAGATAVLLVDPTLAVAMPFAAMALLVWVGSRLSPLWAALAVCVLVGLAVLAVAQGAPPFGAIEDPMRRAFAFQVFIGLATLMTLALSQARHERSRLDGALTRAHRHLVRRARLLQAVAAQMSEQVLVYDEHFRLVWANDDVEPGAAFLTLEGRSLEPTELPWARALAGEALPGRRYRRELPDGRVSVVEVEASLLPDRDGAADERLVLLVVRDVTDQHARVEELQAFAGSVAHDLRTPLTGALGFLQMAQDELDGLALEGVDVAPVLRLLDRSEAAGHRMDRLISDLLNLSASDRTPLAPTTVDVAAVAAQVADEMGETCPEARVELPRVGTRVEAEPRLLRQLLHNLLGNAVKYAVPGERPHITVTAVAAGDRVEVTVADRGVGIPAGEEALVFEPFRRASNHGDVVGSGLGLASCKRTVERHGGRIDAGPGPDGRGTAVTFDLPAAPASDPGGRGRAHAGLGSLR